MMRQIDLFLHDGTHSYSSQLEDLRCAWAHLRIGAVAVIGDVWNPAIVDFAAFAGHQPVLSRRWHDRDAVGLIRRIH